MHRHLLILAFLFAWAGTTQAHGLLIPADRNLPPLAMLHHKVSITIEDQAAVTRVEQIFRNHTQRSLEATYVFPVPRGASVHKFAMWVGGREVKGEVIEADKTRALPGRGRWERFPGYFPSPSELGPLEPGPSGRADSVAASRATTAHSRAAVLSSRACLPRRSR